MIVFLERRQKEKEEQAEILKKGPERKYGKIYYSEWEGEGRSKKKIDLVSPIGLLEKKRSIYSFARQRR